MDIEDLGRLGRGGGPCPYYASRALADAADLVFMPYNYLARPAAPGPPTGRSLQRARSEPARCAAASPGARRCQLSASRAHTDPTLDPSPHMARVTCAHACPSSATCPSMGPPP